MGGPTLTRCGRMSSAGAPVTTSLAGFPAGAAGVTPPTNPGGTDGFLSDVFVSLGFVAPETVEQALEAARAPGQMVERILLDSGALTEEQLSRALAERHGLDHVDLDQFEVDMGAASLIGRSTAVRYRAVPIAFATDGALIVAVADPVDALAISDLEVMTKMETRRAVASGVIIDRLAERLPEVGSRQPAADQGQAAGTAPPAPPASPSVGHSSLEPAVEQASAANGDAARERAEAEPKPAAAEAGLVEPNDLLRERAEAESARLREQVMEATRESDRLREAIEEVTRERDRLGQEAQQRSAEFVSLQDRATSAQNLADQEAARVRELEDADRRAEAARLALTELREESERQREQSSRLEQQLRDELALAEQRSTALEQRLSRLMDAAARAKAMAQDLMAIHDAITGNDIPSEDDGAPPPTSGEPQVLAPATSAGAAGQEPSAHRRA